MKRRVAVAISGRGSNMAALLDAATAPGYPAEIVLVVSDRPDAAGLATARRAGIEAVAVDRRAHADRSAFEAALQAELDRGAADLLCLAGFMRLLSPAFVAAWRDRMINIHPSLLPAFPGLDTHRRALEAGVRLHGCTVHFVRTEMDRGPIIVQAAVPVMEGDSPDSLAARVLAAEHRIYPRALAWLAAGRIKIEGERAMVEGLDPAAAAAPLIWPPV